MKSPEEITTIVVVGVLVLLFLWGFAAILKDTLDRDTYDF